MSLTATKIFADRIDRIEVSATMAITAAALKLKSEGINLADFGTGKPHFATPRQITDAAIDAVDKNFTRDPNVATIPEVRGSIKSASDLAAKLLSEAHVVVVPGEAFGTDEHIRLSYAVSHDVIDEGVKRMREYFSSLS